MARTYSLFALLVGCLLTTGCSGDKSEPTANVNGTVTLDNKPMSDGEIAFVGDLGTITDILPIKNGTFEGAVKLGKKRVEIRAYKAGKAPPTATETTEEFKENYIPEKFNTNSTMTAEVTAAGINPNKFEVQLK